MATRFYLPSSGKAAAVSRAYNAVWEETGNAGTPQRMDTKAQDTAMATDTVNETGSSNTNARDILARQFISDPLSSSLTIAGTLKGQARMAESNTNANFIPQIVAYVVSNDGTTVRGTLYAGDTRTGATDEMVDINTFFPRNFKIPGAGISPVTLSSVSAIAGDRIVVEMGARANNTVTTNYTFYMRFGDILVDDLPEGGAEESDAGKPWIEFSDDLPMGTTQASIMGWLGD